MSDRASFLLYIVGGALTLLALWVMLRLTIYVFFEPDLPRRRQSDEPVQKPLIDRRATVLTPLDRGPDKSEPRP